MPKVLLVDDDPSSRRLVHFVLDPGFQILEAGNGREAVEMTEREHPDILLMDNCMPAMTGIEACARIKGNPETRGVKVVMVTVSAAAEDRERALGAGADAYLTKPYHPRELARTVYDLLGESGLRLGPSGRALERWIPQRPSEPAGATGGADGPVRAHASTSFQLAVALNDAIDHCTQSSGAAVSEVLQFFAEDAVYTEIGFSPEPCVVRGKDAIRNAFLRRAEQLAELHSIERWGHLIVCRLERRDTSYAHPGFTHNLRIILVEHGKVKQLTLLVDPIEQAHLEGETATAGPNH